MGSHSREHKGVSNGARSTQLRASPECRGRSASDRQEGGHLCRVGRCRCRADCCPGVHVPDVVIQRLIRGGLVDACQEAGSQEARACQVWGFDHLEEPVQHVRHHHTQRLSFHSRISWPERRLEDRLAFEEEGCHQVRRRCRSRRAEQPLPHRPLQRKGDLPCGKGVYPWYLDACWRHWRCRLRPPARLQVRIRIPNRQSIRHAADAKQSTQIEHFFVGKPGKEDGMAAKPGLHYGMKVTLTNEKEETLQSDKNGWMFIRGNAGKADGLDILSPLHREGPVSFGDQVVLRAHTGKMVSVNGLGEIQATHTVPDLTCVFTLVGKSGMIHNDDNVALRSAAGYIAASEGAQRAHLDTSGHFVSTYNFKLHFPTHTKPAGAKKAK